MSTSGGFGLVILILFGLSGGFVARVKGNSFFTWFLISGCVPFIGLVTALLWRSDSEELRRSCPHCGHVVMLHDAVCMKCGSELEFPEMAIASEAALQRSAVR